MNEPKTTKPHPWELDDDVDVPMPMAWKIAIACVVCLAIAWGLAWFVWDLHTGPR